MSIIACFRLSRKKFLVSFIALLPFFISTAANSSKTLVEDETSSTHPESVTDSTNFSTHPEHITDSTNFSTHPEYVTDSTILTRRDMDLPASCVVNETLMEKTLELLAEGRKLLAEGRKLIDLRNERRKCVFVIGNPKSGKTTVTNLIIKNNEKMFSNKTGVRSFRINDKEGKIKANNNASTSIFPEMYSNWSSDALFYDYPGFIENQEAPIELATSTFTKTVADHMSEVAIVLVVNYASLKFDHDPSDLRNALRHTTRFIKNIPKFQENVALVVTKVETSYPLTTDKEIIADIANFLVEFKENLPTAMQQTPEPLEDMINIINTLVTHENGTFSKISILRQPYGPGLLSQIPYIQTCRTRIQNMILQNVKSAPSVAEFGGSEPFSNALSTEASLLAQAIAAQVNQNMTQLMNRVFNSSEEALFSKLDNVFAAINSSAILKNSGAMTANFQLVLKHIGIIKEKSKTLDVFKNLESSRLGFQPSITAEEQTDFKIDKELLAKVLDQAESIYFLNAGIPELLKSDDISWIQPSKAVVEAPSVKRCRFEELLQQQREKLFEKLFSNTNHTGPALKGVVLNKTLNVSPNQIFGIREYLLQLQADMSQVFNTFSNWSHHLNSDSCREAANDWSTKLHEDFLRDALSWYDTLIQLHEQLSQYDYQKDLHLYNVKDVQNWGKNGDHPPGILITNETVHTFFEKVFQSTAVLENSFVNETLNGGRLEELNAILEETLTPTTVCYTCEQWPRTFRAEGNFVSVRELLKKQNESQCNFGGKIEILALNTVFIDQDINLVGRSGLLSIISPKWVIVGNRSINLSGADGDNGRTVPPRYLFDLRDESQGDPGAPGGSFLGIGKEFINSENLAVLANGGNGGNGQDGYDGSDGEIGVNPEVWLAGGNCHFGFGNVLKNQTILLRDEPKNFSIGYFTRKVITYRLYRYYPYELRRAGNGGNGGAAGKPGPAGDIFLVDLSPGNDSHRMVKRNSSGVQGHPGKGGKGGKAGNILQSITAYCENWQYWILDSLVLSVEKNVNIFASDKVVWGSPGRNGRDGVNYQGWKSPEEKKSPRDFFSTSVDKYKAFLKEHPESVLNPFLNSFVSNFSRELIIEKIL